MNNTLPWRNNTPLSILMPSRLSASVKEPIPAKHSRTVTPCRSAVPASISFAIVANFCALRLYPVLDQAMLSGADRNASEKGGVRLQKAKTYTIRSKEHTRRTGVILKFGTFPIFCLTTLDDPLEVAFAGLLLFAHNYFAPCLVKW